MDAKTRTHDEWIALRCQFGEPQAFDDLVRTMERPLFYYAAKLLGNEDSAVDVLQEVWIAAFRGVRRLKDPSSLRPWLYRITHGIVVDRIRKTSLRMRFEEAEAEPSEGAIDPSFEAEDAALVHQALNQIESKHREVLVLYFLEEFSISEIAEIVGAREGTVKSRLFYAKKALKQVLMRGGYEYKK